MSTTPSARPSMALTVCPWRTRGAPGEVGEDPDPPHAASATLNATTMLGFIGRPHSARGVRYGMTGEKCRHDDGAFTKLKSITRLSQPRITCSGRQSGSAALLPARAVPG